MTTVHHSDFSVSFYATPAKRIFVGFHREGEDRLLDPTIVHCRDCGYDYDSVPDTVITVLDRFAYYHMAAHPDSAPYTQVDWSYMGSYGQAFVIDDGAAGILYPPCRERSMELEQGEATLLVSVGVNGVAVSLRLYDNRCPLLLQYPCDILERTKVTVDICANRAALYLNDVCVVDRVPGTEFHNKEPREKLTGRSHVIPDTEYDASYRIRMPSLSQYQETLMPWCKYEGAVDSIVVTPHVHKFDYGKVGTHRVDVINGIKYVNGVEIDDYPELTNSPDALSKRVARALNVRGFDMPVPDKGEYMHRIDVCRGCDGCDGIKCSYGGHLLAALISDPEADCPRRKWRREEAVSEPTAAIPADTDLMARERLLICRTCPSGAYDAATKTCGICGCAVEAKVKDETESCPQQHWGGTNISIAVPPPVPPRKREAGVTAEMLLRYEEHIREFIQPTGATAQAYNNYHKQMAEPGGCSSCKRNSLGRVLVTRFTEELATLHPEVQQFVLRSFTQA